MILLDSSAWIHFLNYQKQPFEKFQKVCTCLPVVQEVLQGIRDDKAYQIVKNGLYSLPFLPDVQSVEPRYFLKAVDIYRSSRKKGITIRSTIDCLIAAIALEHDVPILHFDRDFTLISQFTNLECVTSF